MIGCEICGERSNEESSGGTTYEAHDKKMTMRRYTKQLINNHAKNKAFKFRAIFACTGIYMYRYIHAQVYTYTGTYLYRYISVQVHVQVYTCTLLLPHPHLATNDSALTHC